jgi:2-polyprenyl-6-methoxyphenol hydroxylase-like FAD-dependent oxidoreductase
MGADEISSLPTAIIGGGPAGSIAALCLRKLGCEVELFEKARFPRYRVGDSLLPGTLSILMCLGVFDRVEAAGFVKKRAATFLWGGDREPWTFSFATPKTAPWVFDYGLQVNRDEYDQILLDAAGDAGVLVHEECEVTSVDPGGQGRAVEIQFQGSSGAGSKTCAFVVDTSGTRGVVAQAHRLRRSDAYFRNIALWSYFRGGKRFTGDLADNVFSVTFE